MKISEIKVSYRSKVNLQEAPQIKSSSTAYTTFKEYFDKDEIELRETFYILLLNRSNKVKGIYEVSKGGVSGTVVDAKIVFSVALKTMSSSIILCHNHPSGSLRPSNEDISITRKLKRAGEVLDIAVLDHIIITPYDGYYSFADEGML